MRALVVHAHPVAESFNRSLNRHVCATLEACGHAVRNLDLYAEGFAPVMSESERLGYHDEGTNIAPVREHLEHLAWCSGLVFVYPTWWYSQPAILKGWLDRVLRPGVAYDFRGEEFMEKHRIPLLTGMRALVFATSDAPQPATESPLERVWRENVFEFCGIAPSQITIFHEVREASRRTRKQWLDSVAETVARYAATEGDSPHW